MPTSIYPLTWDKSGDKKYENGISNGVLYKKQNSASNKWVGYAWNGLTSVTESPEGADKTDLWADNIKYASMRAAETFGGTIEAYTYPPEFESCNGEASLADGIVIGQQVRESFGLCYRTEQGNDTEGANYGYKLHLVYNCTCSPSERAYETINDSPDAITFSWEFDSTPVEVSGHKPTSYIIIDSTKVSEEVMTALKAALYGTEETDAYLPSPSEILEIIAEASSGGDEGDDEGDEGDDTGLEGNG